MKRKPGKPDNRESKPKQKSKDELLGSQDYTDAPEGPGMVGGPATQAIPERPAPKAPDPKLHRENDGGEGQLSGEPRESGGYRPT